MFILAGCMGVCGYVGASCISWSKERIVARFKLRFVRALVRQEVGWYEVSANPQELPAQMGGELPAAMYTPA